MTLSDFPNQPIRLRNVLGVPLARVVADTDYCESATKRYLRKKSISRLTLTLFSFISMFFFDFAALFSTMIYFLSRGGFSGGGGGV